MVLLSSYHRQSTHLLGLVLAATIFTLHQIHSAHQVQSIPKGLRSSAFTTRDLATDDIASRADAAVDRTTRSDDVKAKYDRNPTDTRGTCHYEDAEGYFPPADTLAEFQWNKWTPTTLCQLEDRVGALMGLPSGSNDAVRFQEPLLIILFGDSLDERMVQYVCETGKEQGFGMRDLPVYDHANPEIVQTAINEYCTNTQETVSIIRVPIYGMERPCHNGGYIPKYEEKYFSTAADRVRQLLPGSILAHIPHENVVVMAGSSLWDLSQGCNDGPVVSKAYQKSYRNGMLELRQAIQEVLPDAPIFWRTSPRMSQKYDRLSLKKGRGRTIANQELLNKILRETVMEQQDDFGVVVDWWNQLAGVSDDIIQEELPDGRHYSQAPSVAFFNLFLNTVLDHHPELLSERIGDDEVSIKG